MRREEFKFLGVLYGDNLILCGGGEEDLRAMVGGFC